jgi:hypothetical protein
MKEYRLDHDADPEEILATVSAVAEEWDAQWDPATGGGRLYLPVVAGLRRGLLSGTLEVRAAAGGGTRLTLSAETTHWRVHRSAAALLVLGALGALPVILWPLSADVLALAPVGLVFMFLAWFMVVSRLRTAGGPEFLEAVRHRLDAARSVG